MSQVAFKYYTINTTNTPQPLVGTWLTASFAAPFSTSTVITIAVNDTTPFSAGKSLILQTPTATNQEKAYIVSVVSSTSMQVKGLSNAHTGGIFGTGDFVSLNESINSVYVQSLDGNVGNLFIGIGPTFTVAGVNMIAKMVKVAVGVQPIEFVSTRHAASNADALSQLFIAGTAADSYLPSYGVV